NVALQNKLKKKIEQALKQRGSNLPADTFISKDLPQATIIVPALLHRKSLSPKEIAEELERLSAGHDNRFTGKTNWIHNNFIGSLLTLYESQPRACPFYAGF